MGLVSNETVILSRWGIESSAQKFGFINCIEKCKLGNVKDLKTNVSSVSSSPEGFFVYCWVGFVATAHLYRT